MFDTLALISETLHIAAIFGIALTILFGLFAIHLSKFRTVKAK